MRLNESATLWYVPLGVLLARRLAVVGAAFVLFIALFEVLRGRVDLVVTAIVLAAILLVLHRIAPKAACGPGKLFAARAVSLAAFAASLWMAVQSDLSAYAIWARGGAIALTGAIATALFARDVARWTGRRLDPDELGRGLARSRSNWPRYKSFEAHMLLAHACLLVLIPVVWIADVAVSPGNLLGSGIGDAFSLEHFKAMLGGRNFWTWTRNSVIVAIGTTLFGIALAVPAAYAFSRFDFAGRREGMFAFILVQMFPGAIILVPYFLVMKTLGLLNSAIGLILVYSVTALPLCIWMLKGFFDAVPRELEEAAKLDGCSTAQIFFRIIIPLSLPALAVTSLFSFLTAWNEFMLALVFNTSNDHFTLPVGLASLIPADNQRWGEFAAASILVSIPVVVLFVLFQKALIQGLSSGAVKG